MRDDSGSKPLVSVYIPTRDRSELLVRAIDSVLRQTYPHIEILVVDDASTDDTPQVLAELAGKWDTVRYICNKAPRGAPAARNQAIRLARGHYVTGLDDDDEFTPDRVAYFLDEYDDEVSFLSTCVLERGSGYTMEVRQGRQVIDSERIRRKNFIGNQVFVRTERIRAVGGFDETLQAWQDYDLWLRLIDRYGPAVKLPTCAYILDRSDDVSRITTSARARQGYEQFIAKHGASMTSSQLRHQALNDLHNRGERVSLSQSLALLRRDTAFRLGALVLRGHLPRLYRLAVRLYLNLSRIASRAPR